MRSGKAAVEGCTWGGGGEGAEQTLVLSFGGEPRSMELVSVPAADTNQNLLYSISVLFKSNFKGNGTCY